MRTHRPDNSLIAVAAGSPTERWAVGLYRSSTIDRTLALHCC